MRDGFLDLVELFERDAAGLVGDDILAVRQGIDRDGGASIGNCGRHDDIDGRITDQARRIMDPHHVGPATPSRLRDGSGWVIGAEPNQLTALIEQSLNLPEGMCMVQADGGKSNLLTRCGVLTSDQSFPEGWHFGPAPIVQLPPGEWLEAAGAKSIDHFSASPFHAVNRSLRPHEDGPRERLASSRPTHRLGDDVEELTSLCKRAALACGTGANPRQPVDPDLDALDIAELLEGVVDVVDQIAHHVDPGPGRRDIGSTSAPPTPS